MHDWNDLLGFALGFCMCKVETTWKKPSLKSHKIHLLHGLGGK